MLNNLGRSWLSLCAVTVPKISSCFGTGLCCGTLLFLQGLLNWWSWQKAYKWRVIILPFLLKSYQSVFLAKVDDKCAIKSQKIEFNSFWRLFIAVLGFSYLILWSCFLLSAVACNKCSFWVCTWSSAFIMVVMKSRLLIWGDFKQGISLCRDHWSALLHNRFHPSSVVSNSCLKILNITFFEMCEQVWRSSGFVFTFARYVLKLQSCSEPSEGRFI
jgi:hypothetical protein